MCVRQKLSLAYQKLLANFRRSPETVHFSLTRFLFDKRHFSGTRVKPAAFTPPTSGKLSACWIDDLSEDSIWQVGDIVGRPRGKSAIAHAELTRAHIGEVGLLIENDPKPHPNHLNLCGWPTEKDEIKSVAIELCTRARLRVRPEG
jgi:hypothetical protein